MSSRELLSTRQAAEFLHVSPRTLIRWRGERQGPPWVKAGRKILYRRSDLDLWIDRQRVEPVLGVS
ncbi:MULTISPECIES: helix-turn-helix domain-containing protein [unclassified Thioalkalivibrio]|uniref:helix-turn-helix domain-containing protein n=1 Tax=unclassified Thioalkalivibrio TaxID=2621013 RepID=UPI0009DA865E|nr:MULTISPECIES: helix-turn-helix domain-containing protein [unclassified Thioalkalivibrio]